MTRPDIAAIGTHHAWAASVLEGDYATVAARPFLLRDALRDAQADRAALLAYIAELERAAAPMPPPWGYVDAMERAMEEEQG